MSYTVDLDNKLGEGRYGIVFQVIWNGKPVAVKRIQLLHIASNQQEEAALQRLDHPNVIKLFHAENDLNFRYYYLELCNASLEKLFLKDGNPNKYQGPMPPSLSVLHQLAQGLEHIHKMELIHRDLKPENVLIWVDRLEGNVLMKWADFGLSKPVNERGSYTMTGVKGSYEWLAPEILKLLDDEEESNQPESSTTSTNRGTIQSDVFTEGLVFGYFLLGGVHLFGSRSKIQSNILKNKPVNLDKIQSNYRTRDLIMEMINKNVADRITSSKVAEVLKEIKIETNFLNLCSRDTYPSLEEVKQILQEGVDINCTDEEGLTPLLCLACRKKDGHDNLVEIIQHLIQHGIKINCKDKYRNNAMTLLCDNYQKENLIDIIRLLIENGIDVNCKIKDGMNALTLLCRNYENENLIDIIRLLIQHGIDVNCKDRYGWNALFFLCRYYENENLIDIIRLLIENGIDVNCKDNDGSNALSLLCANYKTENLIDIIRLLIEKGIDVNCKNKYGSNALHYLCKFYKTENLIEIIRLLIENGIDVNCKNKNGWNALPYLCRFYKNENLIDVIRLLIENGIEVTPNTQTWISKNLRVEDEISRLLTDKLNSQTLH